MALTDNFVKIDDEISPYLALQAKMTPKRVQKALGHAGRCIKTDLKGQLKQGRAGGVKFAGARPTDITISRMYDKYKNFHKTKRRRRIKPWKYMGRLQNAVWSRYARSNKQTVRIGWFARPAERLANIHEKGQRQNITDKMRKHLWGVTRLLWKRKILQKGRTLVPRSGVIKLPERPNAELEFLQRKDDAIEEMERYILEKFERGGY